VKISSYFIDTSSLFKRYIKENGTELIDNLFKDASRLIISNLSVVEIISNLKRLFEIDGIITWKVYESIRNEFFSDISREVLNVEPVLSKDIVKALEIIEQKYMTPIDSLQLSTALYLNGKLDSMIFVCSDKKLCNMAKDMGINVLEVGATNGRLLS